MLCIFAAQNGCKSQERVIFRHLEKYMCSKKWKVTMLNG